MKINHFPHSAVLIPLFSLLLLSCSPTHKEKALDRSMTMTTHEMRMLDSLIEKKSSIDQRKRLKTLEIKRKLAGASSGSNRYLFCTMLFDEYFTYSADSALKYIDEALSISAQARNKDWTTMSTMRKAELLTATGLLDNARELMHSIDRQSLSDHQLIDYYGRMIFLYSHLGDYAGNIVNDFYAQERLYRDSIMTLIAPSHPDYLWFKSWDVLGTCKKDSALIQTLTERMDSADYDTATDAKLAYVLSKLYQESGDMENYKKYMTLSAIADVNIANADIASLEELAKIVFAGGDGDIDRAYTYISYCLNKALIYPNRVRAFNISSTMDSIRNAYKDKIQSQQRHANAMLISISVLSALLLLLIVIVIKQNGTLRRRGESLNQANKELNRNVEDLSKTYLQLNEANEKLKSLYEDLKQKNEELNEANYVKEEYIGYVFTICSNYISKLGELKRSIHVKAIAKKFKDIVNDTADLEMKDELKDFYKSFDSIFLHIYPNFVSDFNTLLQDDKKIWPKEGELLNTELRIYALVRLGITDSVKIADFLHCSPQTVYNNRFKVRNKAVISKKEFADTVRKLGKYLDRTS